MSYLTKATIVCFCVVIFSPLSIANSSSAPLISLDGAEQANSAAEVVEIDSIQALNALDNVDAALVTVLDPQPDFSEFSNISKIIVEGDDNVVNVKQQGDNLYASIGVEGNGNGVDLSQQGERLGYQQNIEGADNEFIVTQKGVDSNIDISVNRDDVKARIEVPESFNGRNITIDF